MTGKHDFVSEQVFSNAREEWGALNDAGEDVDESVFEDAVADEDEDEVEERVVGGGAHASVRVDGVVRYVTFEKV